MSQVLPVKGPESMRAFNVYNALIFGVKMLPTYAHEPFEDFVMRVAGMPEVDQAKIFREGLRFVNLDKDDIKGTLMYCADTNGVPYSAENIKNLNPVEIMNLIIPICISITKYETYLVSESEKKNLKISQ